MAAVVASPHHGRDVFSSVFPTATFTTPTPEATPNIGSIASPARSFGGFNMSSGSVDESVKFNRAWSAVTRYLSLGSDSVSHRNGLDLETVEAFCLVLDSHLKQLASWYANEIKVHFGAHVLSHLQVWKQPFPNEDALQVLQSTLKVLQTAQHLYLDRIDSLRSTSTSTTLRTYAQWFLEAIRDDFHSRVLNSFPKNRFESMLSNIMYQQLQLSLEKGSDAAWCLRHQTCECSLNPDGLPLRELHEVGLGKSIGQKAFSLALLKFLQGPAIARRCFQVDWSGQKSVVPKLRAWIKKHLFPVVEHVLAVLTGDRSFPSSDTEQLVSRAITELGCMRTVAIFDYVKAWPASAGAIQDIWEYISAGKPADKVNVCDNFSLQIKQRLLHAGASTAEILGIYVNVIHVFKSLDSRGVLLDKVAIPIREFLRTRDDTVSIVAATFLADVDQEDNVVAADLEKICPDITIELTRSTLDDQRDNKSLNWNDMEWTPDPIDAGPDYKSSRSEDVVTNVLGLFKPEEFVEEFRTVLAQHLLDTTDFEYIKEIRVIELLKSRLVADKLQHLQVMLKDMQHSVKLGERINQFANYEQTRPPPTPMEIQAAIPEEGITLTSLYSMFETRMKQPHFLAAVKVVANKRNDLFFAKRTRIPPDTKKKSGTNFKAQILSSEFWPQLRSNDYNMPASLQALNSTFEIRFEELGTQQKLHFQPALSKVSIRLDLEDRTIEESDVPSWRASVIDMFASAKDNSTIEYDDAVALTTEQLTEALNMEEELVQDALNFWTSKSVLYRRLSGAYSIFERLDMEIEKTQHQDVQPDNQDGLVSAVKSQDAMLRESAPMFSTFIANMLRNQGPKEVGGMMGITSLLKMVLPSFTHGEEEVRWLLGEMMARGEVVREGEVWKVVT